MAISFTHRVFARNLLRGNYRRNTFCILFWYLAWSSNPGFMATLLCSVYTSLLLKFIKLISLLKRHDESGHLQCIHSRYGVWVLIDQHHLVTIAKNLSFTHTRFKWWECAWLRVCTRIQHQLFTVLKNLTFYAPVYIEFWEISRYGALQSSIIQELVRVAKLRNETTATSWLGMSSVHISLQYYFN